MAKFTTNSIGTLEDNSSLTKLNENFQIIVDQFDNVVSRDGTAPSTMLSDLDMNSNQILNLPDATTDQEPLTLGQFNTYYTDIVNNASLISSSVSAAAQSESNAAISEANAAISASSAASFFDSFDDRYLGAKSSDPAVDNDGNALLTGVMYWNTSTDEMRVWDGSSWATSYTTITGAVSSVNSKTGAVLLNPDDLDDGATSHKFASASQLTKIDNLDQGLATTDNVTFNNIAVTGTVDGRDIAADGKRTEYVWESRAAVTLANIDADVDSFRTLGYSTPGDGGEAIYKRVVSEPSHSGKVQSADGAWWELSEKSIRPEMFGGTNAAAIQAALNYFNTETDDRPGNDPNGGEVLLSHGTYDLGSTSITLRPRVSIRGEGPNATFITYSGSSYAFDTTASIFRKQSVHLSGFTLNSAADGIRFYTVRHGGISNAKIYFNTGGATANKTGIYLTQGSWWNNISNVFIDGNDDNGKLDGCCIDLVGLSSLGGNRPNVNVFDRQVTFERSHRGIRFADCYGNTVVGPRFEIVRYCVQHQASSNRNSIIEPSYELNTSGEIKAMDFNSGGTNSIISGDTITGLTSGATAYVTDVELISGSWASGNASGTLHITDITGTFSSGENVSLNGVTNEATLTTLPSDRYVAARAFSSSSDCFITNPRIHPDSSGEFFDYKGGLVRVTPSKITTATVDFGTITAGTPQNVAITVLGVRANAVVSCTPTFDPGNNISFSWRVSANDEVTIRAIFHGTGTITPTPRVWGFQFTNPT